MKGIISLRPTGNENVFSILLIERFRFNYHYRYLLPTRIGRGRDETFIKFRFLLPFFWLLDLSQNQDGGFEKMR